MNRLPAIFSLFMLVAFVPCNADANDNFYIGNYDSAINDLNTQLKNTPVNTKAYGELLFNIGSCAYESGNLSNAEKNFREAIQCMQTSCGDNSLEVTICEEGLVATLIEQGNIVEADEILDKMFSNRLNVLHNNHPMLLRLKPLKASVAWEMGDTKKAEQLYIETLMDVRKIYGNVHPTNSSAAQCLGNLYLEIDNDLIAETMHRQSKFILSILNSENHPIILSALNSIASINIDANLIDRAENSVIHAFEIIENHKGSDSISAIEQVRTLTNLGRIQIARGNTSNAIELFEEAVKYYNNAWLTSGRESTKATFLNPPHALLAAALLSDNKPHQAWLTLEQMRGQIIKLSQIERQLPVATQKSITQLRKKLISLENRMTANNESDLYAIWTETNSTLTDLLNETTGKLLLQSSADFESVQNSLQINEAVIGWLDAPLFGGKFSRYVYVIKSSGDIEWQKLPSSDNDRNLINSFVQSIHSPLPFTDSWETISEDIWEKRFAPVSHLLTDVHKLYAVCSGTMAGIPLDAVKHENGNLLVDQICLVVTPSATLINNTNHSKAPLRNNILLIADPSYNENHNNELALNTKMPNATVIRSALSNNRSALEQLPRLLHSRSEVRGISDLFTNCELLLDADASEENLTSMANSNKLSEWRVLHFATHALVDPLSSDRSAFVLSQMNLPKNFPGKNFSCNDGLVSAKEIKMSWDLNADLVVLSACETGLGRQTESDGYLGLTNSFMAAGANNLVTSLWKVNDKATEKLMTSFYKRMSESETFNPSECLMLAKQDLRNFRTISGSRPYNSPNIWSSFVFVSGVN